MRAGTARRGSAAGLFAGDYDLYAHAPVDGSSRGNQRTRPGIAGALSRPPRRVLDVGCAMIRW